MSVFFISFLRGLRWGVLLIAIVVIIIATIAAGVSVALGADGMQQVSYLPIVSQSQKGEPTVVPGALGTPWVATTGTPTPQPATATPGVQ